jgi:hypothetical protein
VSSRREASPPPSLPGFEVVRLLGTGGFADVFLYRQQMPRRPVAVKVLLASSLDDDARERFRTEADIMATVSHHPSIVTVYHADVARDGRPYLVMEYCSRPGLGQRYRAERMAVAEVLRIGVRLASAVETAHRAGILHRDIKPANVLVTDFGWPALTDFGIAATAGLASGATVGMSIPWSPPEMLAEEPTGDVRSDVYSLAATVYSLLARRSPFEVPDASNSAADLIARIERSPLARTGRGDVPDSLHSVLDRAMSKDPGRRYHSALSFARALQQVEAELMLASTPLDLPEEAVTLPAPPLQGEAGQATRLRPVRTVSPEATELLAASATATAPAEVSETSLDPDGAEALERWRRDVDQLAAARPEPATPARRAGRVVAAGVAGGLLVTALAVAAVVASDAVRRPEPGPSAPATGAPAVTGSQVVPTPADLVGTADGGSAVFTWTNPDPQEGDRYLWGIASLTGDPELTAVDVPTVTVVPTGPGEVCIEVSVVRANGRYSAEPAIGCVTP